MDHGQIFSDSLDRCCNDERFFDLFYASFMSRSPSIAEKFSHTNFDRQQAMLKQSLYALIAVSEENVLSDTFLKEIAERHAKMHIGKELYDLWLDSLLQTVKQVDPQWNPDIREAWNMILQRGIELMSS